MSSSYVRNQISVFLATNAPTENVIDLTAEFDTIEEYLSRNGLNYQDNWIGLQFIGSDELPVSVASSNLQGKYRETGAIYLHVTEPAIRNTAVANILSRSETLRNLFRGQRINDLVVESVTPPNFEAAATLQFEGGFTSASIIVNYYRDLSL